MKLLEEWRSRVSLVVQLTDPAAPSTPPRGWVRMSAKGAREKAILHRSGYWIFLDLAPGPQALSWQAERYEHGQQIVTIGPSAPLAPVQIEVKLPPPVTITLASLSFGYLGKPYRKSVSTRGGKAPLTFEANGLPPGLAIDSASGTIAGTPMRKGRTDVTVTVTDHNATRAERTYSLTVTT
jgi:hypothetical protein